MIKFEMFDGKKRDYVQESIHWPPQGQQRSHRCSQALNTLKFWLDLNIDRLKQRVHFRTCTTCLPREICLTISVWDVPRTDPSTLPALLWWWVATKSAITPNSNAKGRGWTNSAGPQTPSWVLLARSSAGMRICEGSTLHSSRSVASGSDPWFINVFVSNLNRTPRTSRFSVIRV